MSDNTMSVLSEPKAIIADIHLKTKSFFKFPDKKFIFIFLIVLLIILAVATTLVLKNLNKITSITALKPKVALTAKEDLEQTIKQTFTDPKDYDIVRYISFASSDRILETKFIDYSKAYQLIYKRYQTSATIPIKKALIKLKVYLKAFPQYKEADFKLPK